MEAPLPSAWGCRAARPPSAYQLKSPTLFFMSNYLPLPLTCRRPCLCLIPYPINLMQFLKDLFTAVAITFLAWFTAVCFLSL
jgi:hypothetical protein